MARVGTALAAAHRATYAREAVRYDRLVRREDYLQQILPGLNAVHPLAGQDVLELGAGTGRLTGLLAPVVRSIVAFDLSPAMLTQARARLTAAGFDPRLAVADHRTLPVPDRCADVALAGWTIVYTVVWYADRWQAELNRALAEMARVVHPGGSLIILETQGTGYVTPHPPDNLAAYFAFLAGAGFEFTWIRTDYRFDSPAEAQELTRFFFGATLAASLAPDAVVLPECTGIWWRRVP